MDQFGSILGQFYVTSEMSIYQPDTLLLVWLAYCISLPEEKKWQPVNDTTCINWPVYNAKTF